MSKHQLTRAGFLAGLALLAAWLTSTDARADELADAPAGISAADLQERLAGYQGSIVLLNFWATWCRPCLKEIPVLMDLAESYGSDSLVLVPVSLDEPSSREQVREFLAKHFPDFQTWISVEPEMDTMVSVVDPAWNEVLPTTYVIGRDGEVDARLQGGKSHAEFTAAIDASRAP